MVKIGRKIKSVDNLFMPQIFAGITICIALLTLIGWFLNMHILSGQWGSYIPMAPMTALAFLIHGFALFLCTRYPNRRLSRSFSLASIGIISFFCFTVIIEFITGIKIGIAQLQSNSLVLLNHIPIGLMSPLTAFSFLLINTALLILIIAHNNNHTATSGLWFVLSVIVINFIVLVGYAFGTPILYEIKTIPTSIPAALAFLSGGIGLFLMIIPSSPMIQFWNRRSFKGQLFRAFVPVIVGLVFFEAWFESRIVIVQPGNILLFHALMAMLFCSVMIIVIGWIAQRTGASIEQSRLQIASLAAIVESSDDAIIGKNLDGIITSWNKGAENIYGYKESEVVGKSITFLVPPGQNNEMSDMLNKIRSGESIVHFETVQCRKDGHEMQVSITVSPIKDIDGRIISTSTIARDISERRRAELERHVIYEIIHGVTSTDNLDELLKLIHQSLKKVLYAENCFVALYDQDTGLFSFPLFIDKFDTTPGPLTMLKSCTAYVFRTEKPLLLTQELFDGLVKQGEVELVGSNSPSWVGVPLQTPSKIIGVLVIQNYDEENVYSSHDVEYLALIGSQIAVAIERKLIEEEILKRNKQLSVLNAEKDKFFSIIAHDLRSPFGGFIALTEMMSKDINIFSPDELSEIAHKMNLSAQNLFNLLQNLLKWAQFKKGSLNFTPGVLSLSAIASKCIEHINQRAVQKGIAVINEVPLNQEVFADKIMIESILGNLLSNSVKFTKRDGTVKIKTNKNADQLVEIAVSDSGIGMTKNMMEKLFKINEQTGRKGTNGELSTGLGLLLCKEFVEKNNGRIWADTTEGKGSTFYFTLPSGGLAGCRI